MMLKLKLNLRLFNKMCIKLLVMALIITAILISILQTRISNLNKEQMNSLNDLEDDEEDEDLYNEYMVDKVANKIERGYDIELMRQKVKKINKDQRVYRRTNEGSNRKVLAPTVFIIVVQVHHKVAAEYFIELLLGLKYARGIYSSLIIFSHDYYDEEINTLIERTNFSTYTQIYYPYSTQLFPNTFPGSDQKLCTNDFQCEDSLLRYEEFAQKKHFWWWQMNHVFDELNITQNYNKTICFLEANQFVLRDFLIVAKVMESLMKENCTECEILNLGARNPEIDEYNVNIVNLTKSPLNLDSVSIGIAFNRTIWNVIKKYSFLFCNYNDYRWEASLKYLSLNREEGPLIFLSIDAPRIIQYHKCDSHVECSPERIVEDTKSFAEEVRTTLFPKKINIQKLEIYNEQIQYENETGGWEDDRDRGLCMYFVKS